MTGATVRARINKLRNNFLDVNIDGVSSFSAQLGA
jgi:hypothetical protein